MIIYHSDVLTNHRLQYFVELTLHVFIINVIE